MSDPTAASVDAEVEMAGVEEGGLGQAGIDGAVGAPRTFWSDAWRILRRRWLFWVALVLIVIFVLMAIVPQIFVWPAPGESDPAGRYCAGLGESRIDPSSEHWFGTDTQGCEYYTQVIYGAQSSMRVAIVATLVTLVFGLVLGGLAGYYGGRVDSLLSRLADGFFALPYLVGAIIILSAVAGSEQRTWWHVTLAIAFLGWPAQLRLFRGSVLQVKNLEYVEAARALGASDARIMLRHILPNAVAPVLVYATVSMGAIISVEATLSFLGIGLPINEPSWGNMINEAQEFARAGRELHLLLFPSIFLVLASLGFVLMGEQLRAAFDPRFR